MKRFTLLFAVFLFVGWTNAATYLVQPGGSGAAWSGVSGTVVDLTVQGQSLNDWYKATAITSADQIWIIQGTYTLTDSIVTKSTEKIYGGFAGTETTIGARTKGTNAWDFTNETIIDGNALVRGIVSTTGATIDGLSIQNCAYSNTTAGNCAAAVKLTTSSILQNSIVRNNTITGLTTGFYSGGVYLTTGGKLLNSYVHHNSSANIVGGGNGGGVYVYQLGTVDGCTISNNTAYASGGGVQIFGGTGGVVVNNCIISNNTSTNGGGGGVNTTNSNAAGGVNFSAGASLTITNCTISSNTAKTDGAGMSLDVANPTANNWNSNLVIITGCSILSNTTSTGNGGGISLNRGQFRISNCSINNNVCTAGSVGGGGIFISYQNGSTLFLNNSIVKGNSVAAGKSGAAMSLDALQNTVRNCLITQNIGPNAISQTGNNSRAWTYQNCTFAANVNATGAQTGIYLGYAVQVISTFTNCLFYQCSATPIYGTTNTNTDPVVTYCGFDVAIPTTYANRAGCITCITAASFNNAASGDWSLSPTSAAIDAGMNFAAYNTDITGTNLRPQGTSYDIGAYETVSKISSFTPTSGTSGTTVTITGTNFTGATAVSFGGTAATSFTVDSDTQITAIVGVSTIGNLVSVTTPTAGINTLAGFTLTGNTAAPTISSFSPNTGTSATVIITGTGFTGATSVKFGGTTATSKTVNSDTQITALCNGYWSNGILSVTTPGGMVSNAAPAITSFTPTTAGNGSSVVITGTNFINVSAVKFGGTAATTYIVNSQTQITATVAGGTSGSVSVTSGSGTVGILTGTLAGFTYASPTISSFTPTTAAAANGVSVVITGTGFTGASAVSFGGAPAASYTVDSPTQITATVGAGASGSVSVTATGTYSRQGFTITAPTITSFTPTSAASGASVTITGTYLTGATAVSFGGTPAISFVVNSVTSITAVVAAGTSGSVSVTTPGGTATKTGFTFTNAPTIGSYTPTNAVNGATVVITGTYLNGTSSVKFGGTAAASYVVNSATQITAIVAAGTSGSVTVQTNASGTPTATLAGFIWLEAAKNISTVQNSSDLSLTSGSIVNVLSEGELTINNAAEVNTINVSPGGKVTIPDTKSLTIYGDFNINSNASGTGTFVDSNPNGGLTINGTANVQQYLTGHTGTSTRAYWYLSSPVSAATTATFNIAGGTNKMTYYDETIPGYVTQFNTNSTSLNKGVGYVTYIGGADAAYTFTTNSGANTAKLNTGTITLNPTRTGTTAAKRGFNLIGNPYPSFLDWNAVQKTNVRSTIWYRTYTGSLMQFDTFDGTNGTDLGVNGQVSQYIPPMQAFWVKVTADGLTGSLVFDNSMRSHQNQNQANRLRIPSLQNSPVLRLKVSNGINADEALVVVNQNATDGFDSYDSPKMTNDNVDIPEIYTLADNEEIVINNVSSISNNKQLVLGFRTGKSNDFTIRATQASNFNADTKITLKDNLRNTEQDLTDGTAYSFSSDITDTSTRFQILFKSATIPTGVDNNESDNHTYVYRNANNQIVVHCNDAISKKGMLTVTNSLGQKVVQTSLTGTIMVIEKSFDSGVYFVTVNVSGINRTKKVIIN